MALLTAMMWIPSLARVRLCTMAMATHKQTSKQPPVYRVSTSWKNVNKRTWQLAMSNLERRVSVELGGPGRSVLLSRFFGEHPFLPTRSVGWCALPLLSVFARCGFVCKKHCGSPPNNTQLNRAGDPYAHTTGTHAHAPEASASPLGHTGGV